MLRFGLFLSLFACLACTAEGKGKGAHQPGESPSTSPRGPEPAHAQAPPPYIAVNEVERPLLPLSITHGLLSVRNGCVVFSASGKEFLPVWPKGTRLIQQSGTYLIAYREKTLRLGDNVALPGGPLSLANTDTLQVKGEIPAQCPKDAYAIG